MRAVAVKNESSVEEMRSRLRDLAGDLASQLAALDAEESKELLGVFVSELFLNVAEQSRRADRRQKQAEGIAAAKARGVRFGRPTKASRMRPGQE